jgi:class 3 adenylate cyclase
MAIEERQQKVDLMRLIGRSILKSEKGMYINTWGDGVIAGFDDPTQGLRCACKFVSHLDVDGVEVRVGVNWGVARITYNEITERTDIDGESVNVGARIEPLAQPGEVLASDVVCGLEELEKSDFLFTEKTIELRKSVGGTEAGDKIKVHSIKYYPNK